MAKRKSDWYKNVSGTKCPTCGGSGSQVDKDGRRIGVCPTCHGFGKVT